jgi:hypothetical protein
MAAGGSGEAWEHKVRKLLGVATACCTAVFGAECTFPANRRSHNHISTSTQSILYCTYSAKAVTALRNSPLQQQHMPCLGPTHRLATVVAAAGQCTAILLISRLITPFSRPAMCATGG